MKMIKITALENGAHGNLSSPFPRAVPEGWAQIPDDMALPDSYPFVDIEVADVDGVPTITAMTPREVPPQPETPAPAPTNTERIAALEAAQSDTDSLMVDQEYRLTLLELGINETTV